MSDRDRERIRSNVAQLVTAFRSEAEPPADILGELITTALCDLNRIADELEARPGYCAPKPLSETRFGGA